MNQLPFISIVIPAYNEERFIDKSLSSIISQDYPKEKMEVFVVDGGSNDTTVETVERYCENFPFIKILQNPKKTVPYALNLGIKASKGEVIIRMDAHSDYPTNYFSILVNKLFELGADNVGGVCKTIPAKNNLTCKAIAIATSHKFGVGNSLFRTGTKKIIQTDTVPFGCFRKEIFEKIGLFDLDLTRNQDDEFNGRILKNGGKIFLIPDLEINYYARDSFKKMAKMFFQYGLFKPLVNKKLGKPATLRQFAPPAFVLGLTGGVILSPFSKLFLIVYLSSILIYLMISIGFSLKKAIGEKDVRLAIILPITFFIIHFSYGWGYLLGIVRFILLGKKSKTIDVNR